MATPVKPTNVQKLPWERKVTCIQTVLEDIFGTDVWDDSSHRTAERVLEYWFEYADPFTEDFEDDAWPGITFLVLFHRQSFAFLPGQR